MTDKEQIIIDGVDIIDCDYFYVEQETDQVKCDNYSGYCREHKNCPFKQLARKTQECENLKEDYKELEQRHNRAFQDFERLKQEIKELKSESFTREELITLQEKDIDRYRKALEEIEELCEEILEDLLHYSQGSINTAEKILNIINKAKKRGGEND